MGSQEELLEAVRLAEAEAQRANRALQEARGALRNAGPQAPPEDEQWLLGQGFEKSERKWTKELDTSRINQESAWTTSIRVEAAWSSDWGGITSGWCLDVYCQDAFGETTLREYASGKTLLEARTKMATALEGRLSPFQGALLVVQPSTEL